MILKNVFIQKKNRMAVKIVNETTVFQNYFLNSGNVVRKIISPLNCNYIFAGIKK